MPVTKWFWYRDFVVFSLKVRINDKWRIVCLHTSQYSFHDGDVEWGLPNGAEIAYGRVEVTLGK